MVENNSHSTPFCLPEISTVSTPYRYSDADFAKKTDGTTIHIVLHLALGI